MTEKQTFKIYNGDIEIEFYPNSHRYKLAGEKNYLISVTAITGILDKSRVLMKWAVDTTCDFLKEYFYNLDLQNKTFTYDELAEKIDEANRQYGIKKQEAGDIGHLVHSFAEQFALFKTGKAEKPSLPESNEAKNGINAFLDWFMNHKVEFIEAERLVYSKEHGYVGMADGIAIVDGRKYLIDYKTGNGIYNEHYLQVTGYRLAYEEETGEKLEGCLILHFDKHTGEFNSPRFISDFDHEPNAKAFLNCFEIAKRNKELNKQTYGN